MQLSLHMPGLWMSSCPTPASSVSLSPPRSFGQLSPKKMCGKLPATFAGPGYQAGIVSWSWQGQCMLAALAVSACHCCVG